MKLFLLGLEEQTYVDQANSMPLRLGSQEKVKQNDQSSTWSEKAAYPTSQLS